MTFESCFPIWNRLTHSEQNTLRTTAYRQTITKGTILIAGSTGCMGLLLVQTGQLRAFTTNTERELTLYRLFEHDMCLFSASCVMSNIQFDIYIEAVEDTSLWVIPTDTYKHLMNTSLTIANYTNDLMASRLSDVMWLIEQVMWHSFDKRLANFLLEESTITGTTELKYTHEQIANHIGSAREVVTRMLKHFQTEGIVQLSRGIIKLTDIPRLNLLVK